MSISRRQFLKELLLSIGLLLIRWPAFLRQLWTGARAATSAGPLVAIVTGADYDDDLAAMTRAAVALATDGQGMSAIVSPGDRVFIKPNFTGMSPPHTGDTTKPAVVAALAEMCLEAGARRVTIGEAAGLGFIEVANFGDDYFGYLRDAIADLNERFGTEEEPHPVRAVDTKHGAYYVFVPARANMQTIALSHHAAEADVVISVPVLKTHMECLVVLGIKNLFGLAPPPVYDGPRHKLHQGFASGQQIHQVLVDVAAALRPALTVMDGSIGLEGNGPHHHTPGAYRVDVRDRLGHWLVLASRDPVALDATSTRVIGLDPERSEHLVLAHEQGLGEIEEAKIQIVGTPLDEVRMSWLAPSKGIMMEAEPASVPAPRPENLPPVQSGPIIYADHAVSCGEDQSWQFGDNDWAQASVAYIGEPYAPEEDYEDPEGRTAAVAFHVERPGTYLIFGRVLADTPGGYPPDRLCALLRDAAGIRQQELIFQRTAPLATWYFDKGWYWQSYGMYELDVGDYALSFKSAYLRRRLAAHCFFLAPLLPLPGGRLCVVPPFRPLEARGPGWSPQGQLLTSTTPGAEAQVPFDVPLLAEYDVHLVARIPPGYRLGVRLEQGGAPRDIWLTGETDRWQVFPLGQVAWMRGEAAIGFQNDLDNGTEAVQVDALLFVPQQHRVWLPLVLKESSER